MKLPANKDLILVGIQFLLLLLFVIPLPVAYSIPLFLKYPGMILASTGIFVIGIAIVQLNKNLTPFPTPVSNGSLIRNGVFALVRHPIYSGILFCTFGLSFFYAHGIKLIISIILWILFWYKSQYEEKMLIARFPEYVDYKKNTGRFLPKL